jgi:hypothetical protein
MGAEVSENASTAVETTATGVGLAIAGPVGALTGAAVAPVLTRVGRTLVNHIQRRAEQVLQPAMDELGGEAWLGAVLADDPGLAALVVRAVTEAGRSAFEDHVRAMGLVLRDALAGEVEVEPASDLVETLAALNPTRVLVLRDLRDSHSDDEHDGHWDRHVVERLGIRLGATRAALLGLQSTAAVASMGAVWDGGERWQIEPLGLAALDYLREVVDEHEDPVTT